MKLDDEKKELVREIADAIHDSISNSKRISDVVSKARAADIDIELSLDGTIKMTEWAFQEYSPDRQSILRSSHFRATLDGTAES
jgi:uncharacterized protein (UPF0128 family)